MGCPRLAVHKREGTKAKLAAFPLFPHDLALRGRATIFRLMKYSCLTLKQGVTPGVNLRASTEDVWSICVSSLGR